MLLGQHLGGHHHRALVSGGGHHQQRRQHHHRLAAAHFSLQQAIHGRRPFFQIVQNFLKAAILRIGQAEGQRIDEPLQDFPVCLDWHTFDSQAQLAAAGQHRQLQGQQFIESQPAAGLQKSLFTVRVVGLPDGFLQRHQVSTRQHLFRHNLIDAAQPLSEGLPGNTTEIPPGQTLGQRVDRRDPAGVDRRLTFLQQFVIRRFKYQLAAKDTGFAADGNAGVGLERTG